MPSFNWFAITSLSVAIVALVIVFVILIFGKTKLHKVWMFFNLAILFWGAGCFLVGIARTEEFGILGWKVANAGGFFLGPLFFHFSLIFCKTKNRGVLAFGYAQAVIFNILTFSTNLVINKTRHVFGLFYHDPTWIYQAAVVSYLFLVGAGYRNFIRQYFREEGGEKTQLTYILVAFSIGFLGGT